MVHLIISLNKRFKKQILIILWQLRAIDALKYVYMYMLGGSATCTLLVQTPGIFLFICLRLYLFLSLCLVTVI